MTRPSTVHQKGAYLCSMLPGAAVEVFTRLRHEDFHPAERSEDVYPEERSEDAVVYPAECNEDVHPDERSDDAAVHPTE